MSEWGFESMSVWNRLKSASSQGRDVTTSLRRTPTLVNVFFTDQAFAEIVDVKRRAVTHTYGI